MRSVCSLLVVLFLAGPATAEEVQHQLVELVKVDPTLRLDIRYASDRNFLGFSVYRQPRAFLVQPAAEALKKAHLELRKEGYGLLILDGYRPWAVTKLMWDRTPPEKRAYVADPKTGSRHNRGCAVDLTLWDLKKDRPAAMPSAYDDFSEKAHSDYSGGSPEARRNRGLLKRAMESHGFKVLSNEWWHFDYQGWEAYPILDVPFEDI